MSDQPVDISGFKDLNFTVIKEPWNIYQLDDGSKVRQKYILTRIFKKAHSDGKGVDYRFNKNVLTRVFDIRETLHGEPTLPLPNKYEDHIDHEIKFEILSREWNEYIAEDGTKFRVELSVSFAYKTTLYDAAKEPIYYLKYSEQMIAVPPTR